jgi:hypothetical protein
MAAITLQFSTMRDWESWAIREFSHGPFSHVDAVLPDGSLLGARDDVYGGIPSGVRIRPAGYANFTLTKQVTIPCTNEQEQKWLAWLHAQVGKPYDETAIVAFAIGRDWRAPDSWFCSEMGAASLEPDASGILPYKIAATENHVDPDDLFLIVSVLTNVWAP